MTTAKLTFTEIKDVLRPHFAEHFISGFVGDGWAQLVLDTHNKLVALDPDYTLDQIKEKYGQLRYYAEPSRKYLDGDKYDYYDNLTEEELENLPEDSPEEIKEYNKRFNAFYDILNEAETRSENICEICGFEDTLLFDGPPYNPFGSPKSQLQHEFAIKKWADQRKVLTKSSKGTYWLKTLCEDCRRQQEEEYESRSKLINESFPDISETN